MSSDLIPFSALSLSDAERLRAVRAITAMLESYAQRPPGMADFVKAFAFNVTDVPINVIEATARRFAKGEVTGRNNAFPPSSAEFREAALASVQGDLVRKRADEAIEATRRMLEGREAKPRTDEAKAAIQALADSFRAEVNAKNINAKAETTRKASEAIRETIAANMIETGQAATDPAGIMEGLANLRAGVR